MDVVITTAQVPGRRPPVLVTADAVKLMKPGSVIVDMAASDLGGNVELSKPGETIVTDNGVTIIAPTNLPATMPAGASAFYARNISALLLHMVKDGALDIDLSDEITGAVVIAHGGKVVQEATAKLLGIEVAAPTPAAPTPEAEPVGETAAVEPEPVAEAAPVVEPEPEAEIIEKVLEEEAGAEAAQVSPTESAEITSTEVPSATEAAETPREATETPETTTTDGGKA
jgi:hypothetical protein